MKLGLRLAAIAALVPPGSRVADIGADHAYLTIYLVGAGLAPFAVAGDVHCGPYEAARTAVAAAGLEGRVSVRFGDGLAVVEPGEVTVAVVAGMGGATIIDILAARPAVAEALSRLVLQPMQAAGMLRRWLAANGWRIAAEDLAEEDGRLYEIIAAEPGTAPAYDAVLHDVGPLLWSGRHPLLKKHLGNLLAHYRRVTGEMARSPQAEAMPRYREYRDRIGELEELLACL